MFSSTGFGLSCGGKAAAPDQQRKEHTQPMLEEKRKDLDSEKQKRLLRRLLEELSASDPNLYYGSTSDIALMIQDYIESDAKLAQEERALLARLSKRDIEVLLSLH
ncbi:MAG: hypothetical protein AAF626_08785 [Pseudomonadota bacterium]